MTAPLIDFKHVTFKYHAQAEPTLHDLSFQIYPGEKVLIAGASGSGKTTLLRLLNGLIPQAYPGECIWIINFKWSRYIGSVTV